MKTYKNQPHLEFQFFIPFFPFEASLGVTDSDCGTKLFLCFILDQLHSLLKLVGTNFQHNIRSKEKTFYLKISNTYALFHKMDREHVARVAETLQAFFCIILKAIPRGGGEK